MAEKTNNTAIRDRFISDVLDCVTSLKEQFQEEGLPVTDDNITLQKLCLKLEFILQHGFKERISIFGNTKDYWDYICQCLASRKFVHDGIRYVKLCSEVKTSKGKGRAFLRFCLVHGCLADSLQQCFVHEATKDWYHDWALPLHRNKWSDFISSLYDLSDVTFDLSPDCFDLDVAWPTYSRRLPESRFSWRPPSRSISVSSLNSQVQMEHPLGYAFSGEFPECDEDADAEDKSDKLQLELDQSELSRLQLQKRVEDLEAIEASLKMQVEQLRSSEDTTDCAQATGLTENEIVQSKLHVARLEKAYIELEKKLVECKAQNSSFVCNKDQRTNDLVTEEKNVQLESELSNLKKNFESVSSQLSTALHSVSSLETQLFECQTELKDVETERDDCLSRLDELHSENQNLKELVSNVSFQNSILHKEISELKEAYVSACDNLTKVEIEKNTLEKNSELVSTLQRKLKDYEATDGKLHEAEEIIRNLEARVTELSDKTPNDSVESRVTDLETRNTNLMQELQSSTDNFRCQILLLRSEKEELVEVIQKLEERIKVHVSQVEEKNDALSKANKQVEQLEQMRIVLGPLYGQQDLIATQINEKSSDVLSACEKLSGDMKVLASVLYCISKGNYVTREPKEENNFTPERSIPEINSSTENSLSTSSVVPLVCSTARTLSRMKDLLRKNEKVEMVLQTCDFLCQDLIGLARQHKKKLALQNFDLQGTQNVVDTLTKEHQKLQTAEAILKYELREKKKLLSTLRHQIESTREEWNRSRMKTAQSEIEWHNLREEFAARHKQASEESGFVDDRHSEGATSESTNDDQNADEILSDQSESSSAVASEANSDEVLVNGHSSQGTAANSSVPSPSPSSSCEGGERTVAHQRSRLDILEEQYQLLYSSLVRSSKRSEILEQRLEAILGNSESLSRSHASSSTRSQEIPVEASTDVPVLLEVVEPGLTSPVEDLSQSSISLENGPDSDNGVLASAVSEESLDCDLVLSSSDGLLSFEVQQQEQEERDANGNVPGIPEPLSDIRKRTLESFVTRLKDEKLARIAREADFRAEIEMLRAEKAELEVKVLSLQHEKQLVWSKESEFRKRAEFIFRQERDSFESKLSSLSQERVQLLRETEELKQKIAEGEDHLRQSEATLKERQQELSEKEASLSQQIETLKFQMSTESIKYERALKHYNEQESGLADMREKMVSQELLIESLEETLKEIEDERRDEREQQWQGLEELQVSLSTRDEECSAMNEDLKKTMRELDETRNAMAHLQSAYNQAEREHSTRVSQLETVLAQLRSDNESLKKQIIKLTKDKDNLWKRSETLAQLQFSPTRDRWMADSEVTECLGCKSAFSFTLRKHHCRLCGRIFCHNCANHWVMMVSSSRRTRICTECYSEHIDKTTTKEASLAVDQEGSEEDAADSSPQLVSAKAPTNSSFDSSSVDSLPVSIRRDSSPSVMEALAEIDSNNLPEDEMPNLDQTFLTESSKMDFDVISDEEIARSLSACSPYSPAPSPISGTDTEVQTTATRTIQDIVSSGADGVSGEIWVNAGTTYNVPVILDQEEVILSWEFTSDPKSIAFSVAYKEERREATSQEVLLQMTRVQSHLRPVQGHLIAKHPGLYTLVFSNQFSKYMAKKVSYTLKILNYDDKNTQDSNSS